jgi:hypothetical protein
VIDSVYFKPAELLLRIIPLIDREAVFALKGGTAINFFSRDLPRISVNIDLVNLPVGERDLSIALAGSLRYQDAFQIRKLQRRNAKGVCRLPDQP